MFVLFSLCRPKVFPTFCCGFSGFPPPTKSETSHLKLGTPPRGRGAIGRLVESNPKVVPWAQVMLFFYPVERLLPVRAFWSLCVLIFGRIHRFRGSFQYAEPQAREQEISHADCLDHFEHCAPVPRR